MAGVIVPTLGAGRAGGDSVAGVGALDADAGPAATALNRPAATATEVIAAQLVTTRVRTLRLARSNVCI